MKSVIIAHGEDLDGIVSHTLFDAGLRARFPEVPIEHHFARYDQLDLPFIALLDSLKQNREGTLVYVGDLSVNDSLIPVLKELSGYASISWYDHHQNTVNKSDDLIRLGIDLTFDSSDCTSGIVAKNFLPECSGITPYLEVSKLVDLARRSDFPDKHRQTKQGEKLEKVISLVNSTGNTSLLYRLVEAMREGVLFSGEEDLVPQTEELVDEYNRREAAAFQKLEERREMFDLCGYRTLFSYASPLLGGKSTLQFLKTVYGREAELFVAVYEDPKRNHLITKSNACAVDVPALCASLGGGGRNDMGGFTWPTGISEQNYVTEREKMMQSMRVYLTTVPRSV
ncbi:MAG: hypothetical protein WCV90_05450 [Candidatus Woesearchaeota archaeon]